MPRLINLTGQKFGRLTVISRHPENTKSGSARWICLCSEKSDCGNTVTTSADDLKSGNTRSCGCLLKDTLTIHGLSKTPEYAVYKAMVSRCRDTAHPEYKNYGGRGVTVCAEWLNDITAFYKDMCPRPSELHTLDRENNDKGYSKENCRWITQKEQNNNKRNNIRFEHQGMIKTLAQWCTQYNLNYKLVKTRIARGWTFEEAIIPIEKKIIKYEEDEKSIYEWCDLMGLDYNKTCLRVIRGESLSDIIKES